MATEKTVMAVIRAARPFFRNDNDKVVFAVHAAFLASGYVLTAVGPPAFADSALSSNSTDEVGMERWNELDDEYAFVYTNPEKGSKNVLVKCLVMNRKVLVDALADGSSEPAHFEIDVGEYAGESGGSNYSTQFKNLEALVKSLDAEVLSKLYGSSKAGSSSNPSSSERGTGERSTSEPPFSGSSGAEGSSGIVYPPVYVSGGYSDVAPGSGAGIFPSRGSPLGGLDMVGPNDPRWFGGAGGQPDFRGGQPDFRGGQPGFLGDPGFLGQPGPFDLRRPPGVPPGARYDPIGPGYEPGRFPRRPGGRNHPDLETYRDGSDFI